VKAVGVKLIANKINDSDWCIVNIKCIIIKLGKIFKNKIKLCKISLNKIDVHDRRIKWHFSSIDVVKGLTALT
jgi:hypothetical protein